MTYSGIFDEVDLKEVKKLKAEIKKLKKIIDNLETHMNLKDFEIQSLKERLKNEVKTIRSV
jgi:regulator of replication initiation timing